MSTESIQPYASPVSNRRRLAPTDTRAAVPAAAPGHPRPPRWYRWAAVAGFASSAAGVLAIYLTH